MQTIIPPKLKIGDELRILAPSRSLGMISFDVRKTALERLLEMGLKVTFSKRCDEMNDFTSSSIQSRVEDLHEAFQDPSVKGILTVIGGFNSNQLLRYLDYSLIKQNPKILCGYSDITALQNAILAKSSLVTYSGPHFSSFGCIQGMEYTIDYFQKCLFTSEPIQLPSSSSWSDDEWWIHQDNRKFIPNSGMRVLQEGEALGRLIGGNLCTLNLLQGTEFMPSLQDAILFLEDDYLVTPEIFDRDLQSLLQLPDFKNVKALVIGRFQKASQIDEELLEQIISTKKELQNLPVICNADFGHTYPMFTFPVGGSVLVKAKKNNPQILLQEK